MSEEIEIRSYEFKTKEGPAKAVLYADSDDVFKRFILVREDGNPDVDIAVAEPAMLRRRIEATFIASALLERFGKEKTEKLYPNADTLVEEMRLNLSNFLRVFTELVYNAEESLLSRLKLMEEE